MMERHHQRLHPLRGYRLIALYVVACTLLAVIATLLQHLS